MIIMKNIAHVRLRYLPVTENFIYEEITHIRKYNVMVFTAEKKNLELFPFKNIYSISDLNTIEYFYNGMMLRFNLGCPYFSKLIRDEDIKLLHAHYGPTGTRMLPLKKENRIPLVTSFRGIDASLLPSKNRRIYEKLFNEGDLFLVRSEDMKKDLIEIGCKGEKIRVHHSGIDLKNLQFRIREPPKDGITKLLIVSRLSENKGIIHAIKAVKNCLDAGKKVSLNLIGEGPMRKDIQELISREKLSEKIILEGFQPHEKIISKMLESHILLMPSFTTEEGEKEGIPNVLMEAQATGMPVVSTRHAGIPEAVLDGKTGLLAKEKDADDLADKIIYLTENPRLWNSLGTQGRKHIEEEFNIEKQSQKLENIYDMLIK